MISLQRQLRRNMLLTLLIAMAALLLLVNVGVERLAREYVISRLQHDAESLIAALSRGADGQWRLDADLRSAVYNRVRSGHYYVLEVADRRFASRSLWDLDVDVENLAPGDSREAEVDGPGEESWLTWSQGVRKQEADLTVWVAEDVQPMRQTRYVYSAWALLLIAGTLLVLLALQQWLLKRGFRQLDRVRDSIRELRVGRRDSMRGDMPAEIQPLAAEIDRLLSQLSGRVMRSRNALGNLAHELKRPMQRLTLLVEDIPGGRRGEIEAALSDIRRMLDRELKRARIVGVSSPGRQTVLDKDLPPLIDVLRRIYPERSIQVVYPAGLVLPQDRDDLLELLGNLLDNACKFARESVNLVIAGSGDGWQITVEDDGPGVSDHQLDTLTRRGVRHDESMAGTGLGLSIAKDICDSYGGDMEFTNRSAGGLRVRVHLPATSGVKAAGDEAD